MTPEQLQGELNIAEAIIDDLRAQLGEIDAAVERYKHRHQGEDLTVAVRRLVDLAYNSDDGVMPVNQDDARVSALVLAAHRAWSGDQIPLGQTQTAYLWDAVKAFVDG